MTAWSARWLSTPRRVAAAVLVLAFAFPVAALVGGALRFDEDHCALYDEVGQSIRGPESELRSIESRWSWWPPGNECIYRLPDGSVLRSKPSAVGFVAGALIALVAIALALLLVTGRWPRQDHLPERPTVDGPTA
jgi:hypothetical protein